MAIAGERIHDIPANLGDRLDAGEAIGIAALREGGHSFELAKPQGRQGFEPARLGKQGLRPGAIAVVYECQGTIDEHHGIAWRKCNAPSKSRTQSSAHAWKA